MGINLVILQMILAAHLIFFGLRKEMVSMHIENSRPRWETVVSRIREEMRYKNV